MKMLFLLLLSLGSLPKALASGWQEVGNGGELLLCYSDLDSGVYFFDYFEAVGRYGLKVQYPTIHNDSQQIARELLNRLPPASKLMQVLALDLVDRFFLEATFNRTAQLLDTGDGGQYRYVPENCEKHQLIVQSPLFVDHYYSVNESLWNLMSPLQQGTAIAHEVLYRISLNFGGPESSEALRYVVSLLLADHFVGMSPKDAIAPLNRAHLWVAPDTPYLVW